MKKDKHAIIIVTGIGDHTGYITRLTKGWSKKNGIHIVVFRFGWNGSSSLYSQKLGNLEHQIRGLNKANYKVSLIGISAGASASLNALQNRKAKIHKLITICGRLQRGGFSLVGFKNFPLYWTSIDRLNANLPNPTRNSLLIFRPLFDPIVPIASMKIGTVKEKRVLFLGHIPSILWILKTRGRQISNFIKSA